VRDSQGRLKYGCPLTTDVELDMLQEAYEEALDLVVYLKCAIQKRNENESKRQGYQD
jgi:hypothetical protein